MSSRPGQCITSNAGCYEDDTQCLYAEYMMDGFGPEVLQDPIPNQEMSVDDRNELVDRGLEQCCGAFPEFGSEADLIDYLATLTGIAPACCPDDLLTPWPPGHPCGP